MILSDFLGQINQVFNYLLDCMYAIWTLLTSYWILMLVVAIWVVRKVCKIFHLI